ncbi:hypothetical protein ACLIIZ_03560 [Azonexus caeni]|jgi:hypothetical protein|uniref:hypothetical protein n=1 Tax=Azonexus caeni TaxID=266126 RepID=UPI003A861CD8
MGATIVVSLPRAAGYLARLLAVVRAWLSRRALLRLAGIPVVVLEGRVYGVRAVPFGVARELVPALLRCSQRFAAWQIEEALYDDIVRVLALGLRESPAVIERLTVPLWALAPVIEAIAVANALPVVEAGRADPGKVMAAILTGTPLSPPSPQAPAGPGSTLSNA